MFSSFPIKGLVIGNLLMHYFGCVRECDPSKLWPIIVWGDDLWCSPRVEYWWRSWAGCYQRHHSFSLFWCSSWLPSILYHRSIKCRIYSFSSSLKLLNSQGTCRFRKFMDRFEKNIFFTKTDFMVLHYSSAMEVETDFYHSFTPSISPTLFCFSAASKRTLNIYLSLWEICFFQEGYPGNIQYSNVLDDQRRKKFEKSFCSSWLNIMCSIVKYIS